MLERLRFPIKDVIGVVGSLRRGKVAEIGCSYNIDPALVLASICAVVYPIDEYHDAVKRYKRRLNGFRPQLKLIRKIHPMVAEAEALPFEENSLDGIVFYSSFYWIYVHLGSPAKALRSTHDSLKMGKYAISIESIDWSLKSAKERERMFKDIGFSVKRYGNIVLGKRVLEEALDVSSKDEYLGFMEKFERDREMAPSHFK